MRVVILVAVFLSAVLMADPEWHIETVDEIKCMYTSIDLNSQGYPSIAYADSVNADLKYAWWDGVQWNNTVVDSAGSVGWYCSLCMDQQDIPHISYFDGSNEDVKYAFWNCSEWQISTIDSAGQVGPYTSIAIGSDGYPRICYLRVPFHLTFAQFNGTTWATEVVDSGQWLLGIFNSLVLDSSDHPYISYLHYQDIFELGELKMAHNDGTGWVAESVDPPVYNPEVSRGSWTSIALDSGGNPNISYYDMVDEQLRYATNDGADWSLFALDPSAVWAGMSTSIEMNAFDLPRISYLDSENENLKFAEFDGSDWIYTDVDTANAGRYTSLVLNENNGDPYISYTGIVDKVLKIAWRTDEVGVGETSETLVLANQSGITSITPSPVLSLASISFNLAESSDVDISVYDVYGRSVKTDQLGMLSPGMNEFQIDCIEFPNGVYLVNIQANEVSFTESFVVVR